MSSFLEIMENTTTKQNQYLRIEFDKEGRAKVNQTFLINAKSYPDKVNLFIVETIINGFSCAKFDYEEYGYSVLYLETY